MQVSEASTQTRNQVIRNSFMEYCSTTTIHGIPYLTERNRHWTEKCWWLIAISLSVWFCGSSIRDIWIKWQDYPVIMSLTEEQLPISTVPFPSVTVCPEIKTLKSKLDLEDLRMHYYENSVNLSEIESARLELLLHLCKLVLGCKKSEQSFANDSIFGLIKDMAPDLNRTIRYCVWLWSYLNCSDIFVPIITDAGLCFSFNALNSNDIYTEAMTSELMRVVDIPRSANWSLENGYKEVNSANSYPHRTYGAGSAKPLYFYLYSYEVDIEYVCGPYVPGYRLFLHTPGDILKASDVSIRVPFGQDIQISIKPKLITTAEGLRSYKPSQRKCYFNSERRLQFFKFYSEENCKSECIANYTLQVCGCVKFSMPRYNTTKICGYKTFTCYERANSRLTETNNGPNSVKDVNLFLKKCDCMPSCTSISYETEIDRIEYDWKKYYETVKTYMPEDFAGFYETRVMMYFKSNDITTMRREEQYTNTDFLAICGGILGLCLGVSALSIIEFIYYLTLRLFWSLRNRKSENMVIQVKPQSVSHMSTDMMLE